jgi:hypothetical protein
MKENNKNIMPSLLQSCFLYQLNPSARLLQIQINKYSEAHFDYQIDNESLLA